MPGKTPPGSIETAPTIGSSNHPRKRILKSMEAQPAASEQVTTTVGAFYQWADTPTTVGLIFALAGAIFVGIYVMRRLRSSKADEKKV